MSITGQDSQWDTGIGPKIRAWRNHFGLTQVNLEQQAGLAHNAVSRIENQEVSPRLETVASLASAMGLSVEQLQFASPKSRPNSGQRKSDGANSIIRRLASLSPEKAEKAADAIHRILDLME